MPSRKRPSVKSSVNAHDSQSTNSAMQALQPIVYLWILRLLIPLAGHRRFVASHGYKNDELALSLGIETDVGTDDLDVEDFSIDNDFDQRAALKALRQLHKKAEGRASSLTTPQTLSSNTARLADKLGLTPVERRILEFTVILHSEQLLEDAAGMLGGLSTRRVAGTLAILLDLPETEVKMALSSKGGLSRCGLVSLDLSGFGQSLKDRLEVVSARFVERMLSEEHDPMQLIRDTVFLSRPAALTRDNYPHAAKELDILQPYLQHALKVGRPGVNALIYGPPGTGKSELARMLAAVTDSELFEVASEDGDGDPVKGEQRLRSYKAAQSLLVSHRALLLFDEIEDVFNDGGMGHRSTAQMRKAWMNRMLEENPVPTLWLTNSIECMDQAFLRRFDMVMELDVPPRDQRARIIRDHAGDMLDETTISRIASAQALSPAVIARAAAVIGTLRDEFPEGRRGEAMELLINNTLSAQGHDKIRPSDAALPSWYDPSLLNVEADLESLADGLARHRSGRLCFYGPPGTGKSAWGRWLAERLEMPLLVRRASDLFNMFVGGTEKRIARAFREATQSGAILLIDEVDSFLRERKGSQAAWEVSSVNEMLTQMEAFDGIFIASTNLMQNLDQAVLRRFDAKLHFGYLKADQAWTLLGRLCATLGLGAPVEGLRADLDRLGVLTPGDFAVVARQHRLRHFASPLAALQCLREECELKSDGRQKPSIGFV